MSLAGFLARYGTETQCAQALHAWRWPEGFVCPGCGYAGHCQLGRGLLQCHRCRRQTSLTTWLLKHKLMQTMLERERGRSRRGVLHLDDTCWGGRRRGYKRGRGSGACQRGKRLDSCLGGF